MYDCLPGQFPSFKALFLPSESVVPCLWDDVPYFSFYTIVVALKYHLHMPSHATQLLPLYNRSPILLPPAVDPIPISPIPTTGVLVEAKMRLGGYEQVLFWGAEFVDVPPKKGS